MKIQTIENTLQIDGIEELTAASIDPFKKKIRSALNPTIKEITIDCSLIHFIDSSGLGALISIHKSAREQGAELILKSPSLIASQLLELTRLHRVLNIKA